MINNSVNMMSDNEIIEIEIAEFSRSDTRSWMLTGEEYYRVNNDINSREMRKPLPGGSYEIDKTKPNNKTAHGFMKNLIDEKIGYLLAKEYSLQCDDKTYIEKVKDVLGKKFGYILSGLGYEASNKGIAWLQAYINEQGKFGMLHIPSEQCIPLWTDNSHTELDGMIRYYVVVQYEGKARKEVTKVEYWTAKGVKYFEYRDGKVIEDIDRLYQLGYEEYEFEWLPHYTKGKEQKTWGRVPFIAFKNNRIEYPDLRFIKSLVDNYDKTRADVSNFLDEVKNLIYVLKDYGGQDLAEFMNDMNYFRAIKVDSDGGVDTINPTLDITAAQTHYEQLKTDIIEFGQGTRKDMDKFGSSPSGIALKFLYSGLDLKCNALEVEFKSGFEELLYFVNMYIAESGQGANVNADIELIFNRDITINEGETIDNCVKSDDIISQETILANHPWVKDVEDEMKRVADEKAKNIEDQQKVFGSYEFKDNSEAGGVNAE